MKSVLKLFDKMVEMFPVTGDYLRPDADIVHHPVYESAVVKIYCCCVVLLLLQLC